MKMNLSKETEEFSEKNLSSLKSKTPYKGCFHVSKQETRINLIV